ncbi:MAG: hypothetical protein U9N33_10180 [Campylobacterota bacterium]|nr:hypothetical protein [Campylobacterota bacterium]
MADEVEQASSGGDFLTWSIMFGLLIVVAVGLAIWDKKYREEQEKK